MPCRVTFSTRVAGTGLKCYNAHTLNGHRVVSVDGSKRSVLQSARAMYVRTRDPVSNNSLARWVLATSTPSISTLTSCVDGTTSMRCRTQSQQPLPLQVVLYMRSHLRGRCTDLFPVLEPSIHGGKCDLDEIHQLGYVGVPLYRTDSALLPHDQVAILKLCGFVRRWGFTEIFLVEFALWKEILRASIRTGQPPICNVRSLAQRENAVS